MALKGLLRPRNVPRSCTFAFSLHLVLPASVLFCPRCTPVRVECETGNKMRACVLDSVAEHSNLLV